MATPIDRVKAHFDSLGQRRIEVPEWDLTIFATPVTIAERIQIYSGVDARDENSGLVRIIIFKAKDEAGQPLFTIADEPSLRQHADCAVLSRVALSILRVDAPKSAELGNS